MSLISEKLLPSVAQNINHNQCQPTRVTSVLQGNDLLESGSALASDIRSEVLWNAFAFLKENNNSNNNSDHCVLKVKVLFAQSCLTLATHGL